MSAFVPEAWHNLFGMSGGAAAALAGLLFVAVSLNHKQILRMPTVPSLAAVSIVLLVGIVIVSVFGLIPGQSQTALGIEILGLGAALTAATGALIGRGLHQLERFSWRATRIAFSALATFPMLVCGISVLLGAGGGLYWIALEIPAAFAFATYNAWVLLIEIRR